MRHAVVDDDLALKLREHLDHGFEEHALAGDLGLSRGTVVEAFAQLAAEGYLDSRHGAGTWVAAVSPALRRGVLIDPARSFWLQSMLLVPLLANHSVHPSLEQCTEARVARWRRYGLELAVWTVDSPEVALRLRDWGVRYCITNRPGALRAVLK